MKKVSPLNGKNILVVDDEPDLRHVIVFDLKRRGCNTFEAFSGLDAIQVLDKNHIDIVVSDIRMPNGDGLDLLKEIRKRHPTLPIVLLATGFADLTESDAIAMGAYALIDKPFNRQQMIELLERSCELLQTMD